MNGFGKLNWIMVQYASTNTTRVTAVTFSEGGERIELAGDNDRYPVSIVNRAEPRTYSITTDDVAGRKS